MNNLKGRLFCFEFVFCIEFEDEVHADDSESPFEVKGKLEKSVRNLANNRLSIPVTY